MAVYTRRVQTVLTEDQYATLLHLSEKADKPISILIREAVEQAYFEKAQREKQRAALERILSLDAPVADWEQMEEEITQGAIE